MAGSSADEQLIVSDREIRRRPLYRRPLVWVFAVVLVMMGGLAVIVYRELFVTRNWEGTMLFRVTAVSSTVMDVESVSGSADSTPITEPVSDYIPASPGSKPGDLLRCRVTQTYLVNTDFDSGPRSRIGACTSVTPPTSASR